MNEYYLLHYFNLKNAGIFLLVSFLGMFAVLAVILCAAKIQVKKKLRTTAALMPERELQKHSKKQYRVIESFYEMVFSSTAVLLFLSLYYLIDAYLPQYLPRAAEIWIRYKSVLLLLFIVLSVFLTSWFDVVLVKLTHIKSEQKAAVRLVSSFYIVLILLYIRFIYDDTNYDELILYFITLAVGRFLYFDFTIKSFMETLRGAVRNLPLLLLMGGYSAFICWFGFYTDFLLKSNGVIVSTLIAHLFMDFSIFILHKTRLLRFFIASQPSHRNEK